MHQWTGSTLLQVMSCRLFSAKPLPETLLVIVNWTLGNKFHWNQNRNSYIFIQENAIENVVCQIGDHFCPEGDELRKVVGTWVCSNQVYHAVRILICCSDGWTYPSLLRQRDYCHTRSDINLHQAFFFATWKFPMVAYHHISHWYAILKSRWTGI